MPVRENPSLGQIYRSFRFGDLVDLSMLDTRLAGRDRQVAATSAAIADPNRSLLGAEQEEWFLRQLTNSKARSTRWRVVGQQVMMAQLLGANGAPFNPDQWDGYLASRNRFLDHLRAQAIDNVVVLTGDIHSSWANEIAVNPFSAGGNTPQAVEFVGTSVTSITGFEDPATAAATEGGVRSTHPHIKYVNLSKRGYLLVDVDRDRVQGEFYHLSTVRQRSTVEEFGRGFAAASGSNRLTEVTAPARPQNASPAAP
jgi:alkaline phosphatase D